MLYPLSYRRTAYFEQVHYTGKEKGKENTKGNPEATGSEGD
jgi:hypothetical protein